MTVTTPFEAADCSSLAFKPIFTATTSAKTSRADGASLSVKLAYPNAPPGTPANIRSVKVDLPKQLPSRLTTLQKACVDTVFDANPASCPAASRVGNAKAITPILPVPLEGPAYFVSHGGAKFPELIIVLQGYGFTIDLHGETFISKAGITSSTFRTVPDQPVTSFQLTLPTRTQLRTRSKRKPLHHQRRPEDANIIHRTKRPHTPPKHTNTRHRLPQNKSQGQQSQEAAQGPAQQQERTREEAMKWPAETPRHRVGWHPVN